jgi:hypothetical protein
LTASTIDAPLFVPINQWRRLPLQPWPKSASIGAQAPRVLTTEAVHAVGRVRDDINPRVVGLLNELVGSAAHLPRRSR